MKQETEVSFSPLHKAQYLYKIWILKQWNLSFKQIQVSKGDLSGHKNNVKYNKILLYKSLCTEL